MVNVDVQGGEAVSLRMNKGDVNTIVDSSMDNYCSASRLEEDVCVHEDLDADDLFAEQTPCSHENCPANARKRVNGIMDEVYDVQRLVDKSRIIYWILSTIIIRLF